ncbi:DUF4421 domain-containing protein [Pontibacter qinzhouensis]|uniref:DUF4421 domain-containing protein n=1 Tax=Pontibacter qinzhouensis TaxID=2603253 RepID=A0A5C8IZP0_9BACT|nr:DUF4421 domain-containing protein [Pontibacter qinzhouensis]TXK26768.1 DUF4421 domain-containing protein [Pontibacter qinzhouensis]
MVHRLLSYFLYIAICVAGLLAAPEAKGQETPENEYYQTFPDLLTTRFYFSRKYTGLRIKEKTDNTSYLYVPNTTLNMGVGATYKWATLNLAYGFGFLNPDKNQGDTRYLDLQAHLYPRKMVIDVFGQFYKGYHLEERGRGTTSGNDYYVRPDIALTKIGASVQYLFNHERFSYRAAFLQNEWQKKSAGSFLLGFEMYGGGVTGDSVLVPVPLIGSQAGNFDELNFFEFGPNAGYAYTLVIKKHFFITASAAANLGVGYSEKVEGAAEHRHWGINPNVFLRGFVGYNSGRWSVNANYVRNNVRIIANQGYSNSILTGNYRLNFVYRIEPGPKLSRQLRRLNRFSPE